MDKFCAECGTPVDGSRPQAQAAPQSRWEYQTFTESLNGAKFAGAIWIPGSDAMPSTKTGDIADYIEEAVSQLVARVAVDVWEPDESLNADKLWRAKHVKWDHKKRTFGGTLLTLNSVNVRFKRWVTS
jgi:uncharacterized membrane protein YvbJ